MNSHSIYSGTYSGGLAQFAQVSEKDDCISKESKLTSQESTKAEEKKERHDPLADLKNNEENLSFSKFWSLSNGNSGDQIDWNFENSNEFLLSKDDKTEQQNFNKLEGTYQNFTSQIDELSEVTSEYQNTKRGKKQQVRWRKSDDKRLFQSLVDALKAHNMSINDFCCYSIKQYKPPILMELIEKTGWKCSVTAFIQRIIKLYNSSRKLSWREMKKLRKVYYDQIRSKYVDWDQILYDFPGKDIEFLQETCNNFKRAESLFEKTMGIASRN